MSGRACISTGASPTAGRTPLRLSGFHGPPGGVRGFRAEHGGFARTRRARARRTYPSLSANIHMTNLEIRAGRRSTKRSNVRRPAGAGRGALLRDPDPAVARTRLQHHRCVARLFRRHAPQAALRAEEKAYALPAKLSVPMMVCIFPVLFVVILLPVFVRLMAAITSDAPAVKPKVKQNLNQPRLA